LICQGKIGLLDEKSANLGDIQRAASTQPDDAIASTLPIGFCCPAHIRFDWVGVDFIKDCDRRHAVSLPQSVPDLLKGWGFRQESVADNQRFFNA
jgi:hypothetical protein